MGFFFFFFFGPPSTIPYSRIIVIIIALSDVSTLRPIHLCVGGNVITSCCNCWRCRQQESVTGRARLTALVKGGVFCADIWKLPKIFGMHAREIMRSTFLKAQYSRYYAQSNGLHWRTLTKMEKGRVLSVQSHVVHGYVGNNAATFPLQVGTEAIV